MSWGPKGCSVAEIEEKQAAAQARKEASIESKQLALAKSNEHVAEVAERQKMATSAALLESATKAQEKQAKADVNRAALLKEQVDKAGQDATKARELSNKAKEDFAEDIEQKRLSLDSDLKLAAARKQAITTAIVERAGTPYKKACELSAKKQQQTVAVAADGQTLQFQKMDKAERRRALFLDTQTDKLSSGALWGAALAHNAASLQTDNAPVAFDVDVAEIRIKSPNKSPVQERWASWGPKGCSVAEIEEKQAAAQARKKVRTKTTSLVDKGTASIAGY